VHESLSGPTDAEERAATRANPCFYGDDVAGKPHCCSVVHGRSSRDCSGRIESTRPLVGLGKRSNCMRVASLEVLTAATLVLAIVVVLWGMKIFHGA
jgi:hypothetical protein